MSDASITSILRYDKPQAAAEWLCDALGFEIEHVEDDGDGEVSYISLNFGDSSVLICPTDSPLLETLVVQPNEIGDRSTQICYLTVADVSGHCAAARNHGAKIVREPLSNDDGREFYVCRDLEGHLWSFGNRTYAQPAKHKPLPMPTATARGRASVLAHVSSLLTVALLAALIGGGGVLYLVKERHSAIPAWLNTYAIETATNMKGDKARPPNAPAPAAKTNPDETKSGTAARGPDATGQQLADLHKRLTASQTLLTQAQTRAKSLTAQIAILKKQAADRDAESLAATARLERLFKKAQQDNEESKRLREAAQRALGRSKQSNAEFEARVADLNKQLATTTQTLKAVRADKDKAVAELNRLLAETKVVRRAQSAHQAETQVGDRIAAKERAQFKATIETLNAKLQRVLATLVKVKREKQDVDKTLGATKQQAAQKLAENEKRLIELAAAYERVGKTLKTKRLTLDEIVIALNETRSQLTRVQAAEKKLSAELSKTKTQLRESRDNLKTKVAILQWLDLEAELQRAERELQGKRRAPPPPLPAQKDSERPAPLAIAPPRRTASVPQPDERPSSANNRSCARTARAQLSNFLGWRSANTSSAIEFLCRGAETSSEPVECFRKVIWGAASWGRGGNRPWSVKDALSLCSGTLSARHTLLCLNRQLRAQAHWSVVIEQCTTHW